MEQLMQKLNYIGVNATNKSDHANMLMIQGIAG